MLYLLIALGFMFFAGIAMTVNEGLWNNTISLICVIVSGLVSVTAGVPLGAFIFDKADQSDSSAWYFIFVAVWAVFVITLIILRIFNDKASTVRVRFLPMVDKIGGILMGLLVATMLTSFAANTLLSGPIEAGQWKKSDASDGVRNAFGILCGPFYSVGKTFVKAEDFESSFFVD